MTELLTRFIPSDDAILTAAYFDEEEAALDRAVTLAVREALLDHKRAGNPVVISLLASAKSRDCCCDHASCLRVSPQCKQFLHVR